VATLDDKAVARLKHLAGMLGSDHDGEIASAGRRITELLKRHGLSIVDLPKVLAGSNETASPADALWKDVDFYKKLHAQYVDMLDRSTALYERAKARADAAEARSDQEAFARKYIQSALEHTVSENRRLCRELAVLRKAANPQPAVKKATQPDPRHRLINTIKAKPADPQPAIKPLMPEQIKRRIRSKPLMKLPKHVLDRYNGRSSRPLR
jgi:hypothetical protein